MHVCHLIHVEQKVTLTIRYTLMLTTTPRTVLSVYFFLIFLHFFAYDPKNSDIALTSVITCHHLSEKARPVTTRWMIRPTCLFLVLFLFLSLSLSFLLLFFFFFLLVVGCWLLKIVVSCGCCCCSSSGCCCCSLSWA